MRARFAILIALMTIVSSVMALNSPAWSSTGPTLAQETDSDTEGGGQGEESEGTTPQGGAEDEGGESAEEGGAVAEETGPPWTYQMARIALVLLALTLLGVAFAYYRFVAVRRREGF
jgi:hypothetical protein